MEKPKNNQPRRDDFDDLQDRVIKHQDEQREPTPRTIVLGTWVVEVHLQDGYHWFGGYRNHPEAQARGAFLPMNVWSPYLEDAEFFTEQVIAQKSADTMPETACYVKAVEAAILTTKEHPFDPNLVVSTPIEKAGDGFQNV